MDNQRNLIVAVVLCLALLLGFDMVMGQLYPQPAPSEQVTPEADTPTQRAVQHTREGGLADPLEQAEEVRDLRTALASTNRIAISKHIPQHADINLVDEITDKTGLEAVLENDANAAAYGEYVLGAGRGSRDVFYVTLGTGVGGAFIFNGKLWRGADLS